MIFVLFGNSEEVNKPAKQAASTDYIRLKRVLGLSTIIILGSKIHQ